MATCPLPRQTAASLLSSLEKTRQAICANPSAEIPSDIKKLRQANFKQEYKARHHGKRKAAACVGSPTAARTAARGADGSTDDDDEGYGGADDGGQEELGLLRGGARVRRL